MERILGWAIVPIVMAAATAHAQTGDTQAEGPEPQRCSGVPAKASAAEQALCWFEESERESTSGGDAALRQAAAWCRDAALDDPRVAHACFVAPLRLGRYDEAHGITEYLRDPSGYVQKCKDALTGLMEARVLTDPKGARVVVGGRTYGRSPVTVRLQSPWWQQTITAQFDGHEVHVGADAVKDAFDERVCEMGDVVIEKPEPATAAEEEPTGTEGKDGARTDTEATETASTEDETGTQGAAATAPTTRGSQLNTAGWITTGTGAALLAVAAALGGLALGERSSVENELDDKCGGMKYDPGQCAPDVEGIDDRFNRLKVTAWSLFGVGLAVAGTGVLLLVLEGGNGETPDVAADLQCGARGCIGGVRGRF